MKSLHSTESHSLLWLEAEQITFWVGEQEKNSAMLPVSYSSFICATTLWINRSIFSMKGTKPDLISDKTTGILATPLGYLYFTVQSKRRSLLVWSEGVQLCGVSQSNLFRLKLPHLSPYSQSACVLVIWPKEWNGKGGRVVQRKGDYEVNIQWSKWEKEERLQESCLGLQI